METRKCRILDLRFGKPAPGDKMDQLPFAAMRRMLSTTHLPT
jgi:hypothetical protein